MAAAGLPVITIGGQLSTRVNPLVDEQPFASWTLTVIAKVPGALAPDGVPAMTPVEEFKESPAGNVPLTKLQV